MKKLLYSAAILALGFFAASCQQENLEPVGGNTVTYTVQVPDAISTKGIGDDVSTVTELIYEVWLTEAQSKDDHSQKETKLYQNKATLVNGEATIEFELVNNQNFRVLFWAQVPYNGIYNTGNLKEVTISQDLSANNLNYNAFAGSDYIKYGETISGRTIKLVRPVAQVNIATTNSSLNLYNQTQVGIETSYVTVNGLSTTYNVSESKAGAVSENDYIYKATDPNSLGAFSNEYKYLSMNYVGFASPTGSNVTVHYDIKTTNVGTISKTINSVPVKANYRTNILGNLITSTSDYTITLEDKWTGVADEVEIWDGKFISEPAKNAAGVYEVTKPSELAWLAAAVNGTIETRATEPAKTFAGETFVLTENIDLGNFPWTPIGLNGDVAGFQGTFDGNGKTISNLYVDLTAEPKYQSAGLFGSARVGEIKNFTVKNAVVKNITTGNSSGDCDCGTAVVVGSAQTQTGHKITNVHVINATVEGNRYCAAIAGYYDGAISDCTVDNVTIKVSPDKLSGTYDNGDKAGGILGYANTGVGTTIADCVVKNSTIEGYRDLGGIAGLIRKSVTGCTVENVNIVHNPLNGYKTSVTTFGAIHSGYVTPEVETGNTVTNVTIYAPENVTIVNPGESLQAAIDAAEAPAVIYLAEGTHTGHTVINKEITLLPVEGAKVVYDGHLHINNTTAVIKNITLTNEHPSTTTVQASGDAHLSCASSYSSNVTMENCTFDIKKDPAASRAQYGFYNYQGVSEQIVIKDCTFNCNGERPLYTRTIVEVDGCKFYDQYRYAIQVAGELPAQQQVVTFTNNQIINPCITSGKGFVAGVSISKSHICENVTFNIANNTLQSSIFPSIYYVYDNSDNINMASCTVNGATFVREDQVPVINFVTPSNLATTDFTKSGTYMLMGDFSDVTSMPQIVPTEGAVVVIDASGATFGDKIQFNIPEVPNNSNVVSRDNARKGSYTLTNFNGTTLDLGAYGTSVTITKSTLDCIDVFATNIALDINHNTIDSNYEMHPRCNSGETDYAVCMMMMAYDLKFDNNKVSNAIGHVVAINGGKNVGGGNFATVANSSNEVKSFTGNTITGISGSTKNNRAGFKVWDDLTYAFQGESTYEALPQAGQALINAVENANTFKKAEGTSNNAYKINFYEYYHAAL